MMMAMRAVVVDHALRLHEGIHRGGADKLPSQLLQVFGQGQRLGRLRRRLRRAPGGRRFVAPEIGTRSEEHTSELQSLMRISYAVFCLKKKKLKQTPKHDN